jgi:hypothetical protein
MAELAVGIGRCFFFGNKPEKRSVGEPEEGLHC